MVKDAVRDGLRAVKNAIEDGKFPFLLFPFPNILEITRCYLFNAYTYYFIGL